MQNIDGFDNLAAAIVEETPTSSEQRGEAAERSDMRKFKDPDRGCMPYLKIPSQIRI